LCETSPLTASPTPFPSAMPTVDPTVVPTLAPTTSPTAPGDTNAPSAPPTLWPTLQPSISLTPTAQPSTFSPTVLICPPTYVGFVTHCYRHNTVGLTRAEALAACRLDENGWLATLDEPWKLGVVAFLGIVDDTYFGLFKTDPCTDTACDGKYAWDIRDGLDAPVGNYTLNMKR
jgi:hypothetical protein